MFEPNQTEDAQEFTPAAATFRPACPLGAGTSRRRPRRLPACASPHADRKPAGRKGSFILHLRKTGRINLKALLILAAAAAALAVGAVSAHQVRKRIVANRALAEGTAALERKDWPAASKHLRRYLSKYPDDVDMLRRYAEANLAVRPLQTEHVGAAMGAYRRLLKNRPGDITVTLALAELCFGVGDYGEVSELCRERLKSDPTDEKASLLLAQSLIAQRREDEAKQVLSRLVAVRPSHIRAYTLLSSLAGQARSPEALAEAVQWLDQAVANNPSSADPLAHRARAHRMISRDAALAKADLEAAEALKSEDPGVLLMLAEEWLAWDQLERAEAKLAALDRVWPQVRGREEAEAQSLTFGRFFTTGRLSVMRGATEEAVRVADRALDELTGGWRTQFLPLAVELYLGGGKVEAARAAAGAFREASKSRLQSDPSVREQLELLEAGVAAAEGQPFEVINRLEEVVLHDPQNVPAWRLLSDAYDKTGQSSRAIRAAEEVARRSPGDGRTLLRLAKAYRGRDTARFLHHAKLAEQLMPQAPEAKLLRIEAEIASAAGASALLAELSEELAALRQELPANAMVRVLQARVAAGQGRHQEADAGLRQAIQECDNKLAAAMELIRQRRSRKLPAEAVEACRLAIESRPDLVIPRIVLSELQAELEKIDEARRTLEAAVEALDGQDRLAAQAALAQFVLLHGDRQEAMAMLKDLASKHPQNTALRVGLLMLPETQNDTAETGRLIDELKAIEGPRGLVWRVEQARFWLRGKDWAGRQQEIADALGYCIQADPTWSAPVAVLGEMFERLGKLDKAEETYRRGVDASPGNLDVLGRLLALLEGQRRFGDAGKLLHRLPAELPELSEHRAKVAIGLGEYDSAINQLQQRIAADPKDVASRVVLARLLYSRRRDAETAFKLLDEARSLAPDLLMAVAAKAGILHAEGKEQAARSLLDAQVTQRNDFVAYLLRAEYLAAAGQLEDAEADYQRLPTFSGSAADGYSALGGFYQNTGRVEEAVAAWETGLNAEPDNIPLARRLTKALITSSNPDWRERGRQRLSDLLQKTPGDPELLFVHAGLLLEQRSFEAAKQAQEVLERVVELDPRNVGAHRRLVQLALDQVDLDRALTLSARALGSNPESLELRLLRAELEAKANNFLVAQELARSVLEADPGNISARNLLTDLALASGRLDAAESLNNEALQLDPGDEIALILRARILDGRGRREEAIASLEAYRQARSDRPAVLVLLALADLYLTQADLVTAEQRVNDAAQADPSALSVTMIRLRLLGAQRRFDDILGLLAQRSDDHPGQSPVLLLGAAILASTGQEGHLGEAAKLFERVVAGNPKNIDGHVGLAQVAYRRGEKEGAAQAYRQVLDLDPYHEKALNDLAWILGVDLDKPQEALELAGKGIARYPSNPHLFDTRGVLLEKLDRLAEARGDLEKCLTLAANLPSTQATALYHLGKVLIRQGEPEAGRQRLDQATELDRRHGIFSQAERNEIEALIKSASPDSASSGQDEDTDVERTSRTPG